MRTFSSTVTARILWAGLITLFGTPVFSQEGACPGFNILRYDEDWSRCQSDTQPQWYQSMKYQPLGDEMYVSFGGEARLLLENIRNENWGNAGSDGILYDRFVAHADLIISPSFRVFTQVHANHARDEQGTPPGVAQDEFDIQNLFVDIALPVSDADLTLRIGRQELSYGSNRLINEREGINVRRTFEGINLIWQHAGWRADTFYYNPVEDEIGALDDSADDTQSLYGIFATRKSPGYPQLLDLYLLAFESDEETFNQGTADEKRYTLGGRLVQDYNNWSFETEAMYQWGEFGEADISAWSIATITTYTFRDQPWQPEVGIEIAYASGDDDPLDNDLNTFNPLFPPGDYFSELGQLGPQNFYNLRLPFGIRPAEGWYFRADVDFFWRAETNDGIYAPPRRLLRSGGGSDERFVATQVSLIAEWAVSRHLEFALSATRSMAGDFIEETGNDTDIDYFMAQATFKF